MEPIKIDRIDTKGNILEHLTLDGIKTLCGRLLKVTQNPCGNGSCRVCTRMLASKGKVTP